MKQLSHLNVDESPDDWSQWHVTTLHNSENTTNTHQQATAKPSCHRHHNHAESDFLSLYPSPPSRHPRTLSLLPGAAGGRGLGQTGDWGRLGKSRLSLLRGDGGCVLGCLRGWRKGGSTARTAAVPFPAACPGTERSLCSLPLKAKRNTYAWQISPKMYFSKAPDCLPSLQLQGSPRELGRGSFGVTLGDRERRWGRGAVLPSCLCSQTSSHRRAQLGRVSGLGRQPSLVLQRGKLRLREVILK